jgi:transposase-like protein
VRIRREFSNKFKKAAVRRMETASVAEVAQACGVSVSVLHRWRKQFGNHRAEGDAADSDEKPGGRRIFSKEFKESVVKRLESGESVSGVVRALQLNPTVVRRWRQEWRKYGEAAFSGYGKTRSPTASTRTVIVRFTEEEYEAIKAASLARHASSLPDFVRGQILPAREAPSVAEIAGRLEALVASVQHAASIASVRQTAHRVGHGR